MDTLMIIFVIGFLSGAATVGIAWIIWWHFESRKPFWPPD